ncbi:glycosyltransferase family 41 protein (plasmid) [Azospirillum sp. 412522]|nr:glycosyltransferase family 41 protein [Azospirillum sp. 412522]
MKKTSRKPAKTRKPSTPAPSQRNPGAGVAGGEGFAVAIAHHQAGRLAEAEAGYRAVLRADPGHPHANNNLALILRAARRYDEALLCYQVALDRNGRDASVHSNYGCLLNDMGRREKAAAALRRAVELKPDYAEAHFNLANTLRDLGDPNGALRSYAEALRLKPDMAAALCNLGELYKADMALSRAVDCFIAAQRADPQLAEAYNNLGETLKEMGRIEEAIGVFQSGLSRHPGHALMHSNLLLALNYTPAVAPQAAFQAHADWAARHTDPLPAIPRPAPDRTEGRRLRVGYVSPDFCAHSVAFFAEPLLREHDRNVVEPFCYSSGRRADVVTRRLQTMVPNWRDVSALSDEEAAGLIVKDRIDILVDLTGHTANNRLPMFGRRPAPVQVSWLGYPNTTGMKAMDYRLTDAIADPMGTADAISTECLVRLPRGFHCYQPPIDISLQPESPSRRKGTITFGSFNNISKVTAGVARVWSEILKRVPNSRLLLKSAPFADDSTRARYLGYFTSEGIDPDRIELLARIPAADGHLRAYDRLDIGLDPFPYNGTTTTCEALWMGVPVVTQLGATHVGRVGASLLSHCGLSELIAMDEAGYVDLAVALAGDPDRLSDLRRGMRECLLAAPLTDYRNFARTVETAYRAIWRDRMARDAAQA